MTVHMQISTTATLCFSCCFYGLKHSLSPFAMGEFFTKLSSVSRKTIWEQKKILFSANWCQTCVRNGYRENISSPSSLQFKLLLSGKISESHLSLFVFFPILLSVNLELCLLIPPDKLFPAHLLLSNFPLHLPCPCIVPQFSFICSFSFPYSLPSVLLSIRRPRVEPKGVLSSFRWK